MSAYLPCKPLLALWEDLESSANLEKNPVSWLVTKPQTLEIDFLFLAKVLQSCHHPAVVFKAILSFSVHVSCAPSEVRKTLPAVSTKPPLSPLDIFPRPVSIKKNKVWGQIFKCIMCINITIKLLSFNFYVLSLSLHISLLPTTKSAFKVDYTFVFI